MRRRHAALAVLAASAGLAACGGDDKPSKADFAREANKVCRDIERQGSDLGQAQPDSLGEIVTFAERAERTVTTGVDRLEAIERPAGADGEKATAFVRALSSELDTQFIPALRDLRQSARDRDAKGLREAATRLQSVDTKRSDQLARELGATACSD